MRSRCILPGVFAFVASLLASPAAQAITWHVSPTGSNAANGLSPDTPKQTIQAAVDAAAPGDVVLVGDGTYETGSRIWGGMANRLVIDKALTVRSQNGAALTILRGAGPFGGSAVRGVHMADGAVLEGFTVTNGFTAFGLNGFDGSGGGVWGDAGATVRNCILTGNSAWDIGGGSYGVSLENCLVTGNTAGTAGGTFAGVLRNCTVAGNTANSLTVIQIGGVREATVYNSVVVDNSPVNYDEFSVFLSSCTSPLPAGGSGNISSSPAFVGSGDYRLTVGSPCFNTGNNANAPSGTDLDGLPRIRYDRVDMGAYEYAGPAAAAGTRHVNVANANPAFPYTSWATAAQTIQDAVDAAFAGDTVLVTNGVYSAGGRAAPDRLLPNRVLIDKALTVQSVNGPSVTSIQGAGPVGPSAVRCVWLAAGARLSGFTLQNGATLAVDVNNDFLDTRGAGVLAGGSSVIDRCVIRNNAAFLEGGGAYLGRLENCLITGNSSDYGGGAMGSTLVNCTVTANSGRLGAGTYAVNFQNSIVYGNTVTEGSADPAFGGTASHSCMTILKAGAGNIAVSPQFAGANDFRLLTGSPCINGGSNALAPAGTDLDGFPRIGNAVVDMGAYEKQTVGVLTVTTLGTFPSGQTQTAGTTTGSGTYAAGTSVEISATPFDAHFLFTGWNDGNTSPTRTIVMPPDSITYTAQYTIRTGVVTAYVSKVSSNPVWPYLDWATAATNIQDAVDIVVNGDVVMVGDGVYDEGKTPHLGYLPGTSTKITAGYNRLVIPEGITVRSLNGAAVTEIRGAKDPVSTNGVEAVRCVLMRASSTLVGFTLSQGATFDDGLDGLPPPFLGINSAEAGGGVQADFGSVIRDCVITGNSALYGGGVYRGTLFNCIVTDNTAANRGGGASDSYLYDSDISGNRSGYGGGAALCNVTDCTVSNNLAAAGGGLGDCTVIRTLITGNTAATGAGAANGTLDNCVLADNTATGSGGGALGGTLRNCTVTGNHAAQEGGFSGAGNLANCIVVDNHAPLHPNVNPLGYGLSITHSLSSPLPPGTGNLSGSALFVDAANGNYRLSANSPGINAGNNASAPSGNDLAGNPRIGEGVVDMGAYEAPPGVLLTVNAVGGSGLGTGRYFIGSNAVITAVGTNAHWSFVTWNDANTEPVRGLVVPAIPTTYTATFVNDLPGPVTAHVAVDSTNPVWPYDTWATAATNIQDAIDILLDGDTVLVGNGVYEVGGRVWLGGSLTNRVVIDKALTVQSANGPSVTTIRGAWHPGTTNGVQAVRGVWMAENAVLSGFTVTHGATLLQATMEDLRGGGIYAASPSASIRNCVISGNAARFDGGGAAGGSFEDCVFAGNRAYTGGGVYGLYPDLSTLNRCVLRDNRADLDGGGANYAILNNSLLHDNVAGRFGGGASGSAMTNSTVTANAAVQAHGGLYGQSTFAGVRNSIIAANTAPATPDVSTAEIFNSCVPGIFPGNGNIAVDPQFADPVNRNFRLLASSPCKNVGDNAAVAGTLDLDKTPRIFNFNVDMGAYESTALPPSVYVDLANATPVFPYATWATAATSIQDGVDAATLDATVFVTNGVYQTGSRIASGGGYGGATPNRVAIEKRIIVRSMNGPAATRIVGAGPLGNSAIRGVWLQDNAWLIGFTVTNGCTRAGESGGGVKVGYLSYGSVSNCVIAAGQATYGGGASGGLYFDSTLRGNQAVTSGGGASSATLERCTLADNAVTQFFGGGAYFCTLRDCVVSGNSVEGANASGGGTYDCWVEGGSIVANTGHYGGGDAESILNNTLISGNTATYAGGGAYNSTLVACTVSNNTATLYGGGTYESTVSDSRLLDNSAAQRGGGSFDGTMVDCVISGNDSPSGGGVDGGSLTNCTITANAASHSGGGAINATLRDCQVLDNTAFFSGGGVMYSTVTDSELRGNASTSSSGGGGGGANQSTLTRCTISNNTSAGLGGGSSGGTLVDCLLSGNEAVSAGGGAYTGTLTRCSLIGNRSPLSAGGGSYQSTLIACTISGNSALQGGGVSVGTLRNCVLSGNRSTGNGGGAYNSQLTNCTLVGNSSVNPESGSGSYIGSMKNSIAVGNTNALGTVINFTSTTVSYSCTSPASGVGSFDLDPVFAGTTFALASGSPCRDSGKNADAPAEADLAGNPRIAQGFVDIGAYEFQGGGGQGDYDDDGMGNGDEGIAGTSFANASDVFKLSVMAPGQLAFTSAFGRLYSIEANDDLSQVPQIWTAIANNIPGTGETILFPDPGAATRRYYRVRTQLAP